MLLVVFGLVGCGKTYVSRILEKEFGYFVYEADKDIPKSIGKLITTQQKIPALLRDAYFKKVLQKVTQLSKTHKNLVVSQAFTKEKHREQLLKNNPDAIFLLVTAPQTRQKQRLIKRADLDLSYALAMKDNFDTPHIPHKTITNNTQGKTQIITQLTKLLK